jgi:hypothetical protein
MWEVLLGAKRFGWTCGPWMRSANILVRRGFIEIERRRDGFHDVQLTEAGREALAWREVELTKSWWKQRRSLREPR